MPSARPFALVLATLLLLALAPGAAAEEDSARRGRYIVVLDDSGNPANTVADHERKHDVRATHVYRHAINGYAASIPEQAVAAIARDPRVAFVERDHEVTTFGQTVPTGISRTFATSNSRIDIDGSDDQRVDVDVAIIDTGIDLDHPDLNVVASTSCTGSGSFSGCVDGAGEDDNGHGSHVAGTVAALDNGIGVAGVAPGARLHAVKVLTAAGYGLISDITAGVDWVTARADVIEVVNMSLGCACHVAALDQAIAASIDAGVVYAVAAGNDDRDATSFSPAGHPDVITVSALADFDGSAGGTGSPTCRSDRDDTLAEFSNWGSKITVAAPGTCIYSTWMQGLYATASGTSMASPHVAGAAAILASGANDPQGRADTLAIRDLIVSAGNLDWLDDSGDGIHEALLDVGNPDVFVPNSPTRTLRNDSPPAPTNESPTAEFTHSCASLSCSFDATSSFDPDGTVASYAWDFGDGTVGSGDRVDKSYEAGGTYSVTLVVTDDDGATARTTTSVTVTSGSGGNTGRADFSLGGTGVRAAGSTTVQLEWFGTDLVGAVLVYRNGEVVTTTADDGAYTDVVPSGSGSYTYKVCEEGTQRCSNEVTLF